MRRTCERGTKARLSLSGGSQAPVNMTDSMENAGAWTVVGKRRWNSRRLDVRNIAQYSVANMPFPTGFFFHRHLLLPHYPPWEWERGCRYKPGR